MRIHHPAWRCAAILTSLWLWLAPAAAQPPGCPLQPAPGQRLLAVISDLHLGLGRGAGGDWDATEDFRWPDALAGFLDQLARCGEERVDLVLAGDLLELWQPPPEAPCRGPEADLGCTGAEVVTSVRAALRAHAAELRALGRFADRGNNRVHIVPGNHDAALLLPPAWQLLRRAVAARPARLTLVGSGVFAWGEGRVIVEHGQQIGSNVNRYSAWPTITRQSRGRSYLVRPWGELFVQRLFNEQEREYPIVDNLSPEAAGARYRMADRGLWGAATDLARFMAFNLVETSLAQKGQMLGGDKNAPVTWDVGIARALGHRLFAAALPQGDALRGALLADDAASQALRQELDALAGDGTRLPEPDLRALCDLAAERTTGTPPCPSPLLGAAASALLQSKRTMMADHLRQRLSEAAGQAMRVFVYGHTHLLEEPWPVQATELRSVTVLNSGAFQRVVDEAGFLRRAEQRKLTPTQALRRLRVEDLAPCYGVVLALAHAVAPPAVTVLWHQPEGAGGRFVAAGDEVCR